MVARMVHFAMYNSFCNIVVDTTGNPRVNKVCPPRTGNRISANSMVNSIGTSIQYILPYWGFQGYGGSYGTFCHALFVCNIDVDTIGNPRVNKICPPLTSNRISANSMENSP